MKTTILLVLMASIQLASQYDAIAALFRRGPRRKD
jgi:hypothetical protein